jgi:DNA invertase Pin-like site-specific DNA recombinase
MSDPYFLARGYGRASTDKQVISPLQQEEVVMDHFKLFKRVKPGWANAEWGGFYVEEPITRTSKLRTRPVGSLLLSLSQPGDVIMASNYDRIFANVMDVCETIELIEVKKFRLCILDLDIDIGTDMGQAVFKIMAAVKELEVREIRRRCRETAKYRVSKGLPVGKYTIGWKAIAFRDPKTKRVSRMYVPDKETRKIAMDLYRRHQAGASINGMTNEYNRKGILNPKTRAKFNRPVVYDLIRAAKANFPLTNGSHEAPPIPPDAEPIAGAILGDY